MGTREQNTMLFTNQTRALKVMSCVALLLGLISGARTYTNDEVELMIRNLGVSSRRRLTSSEDEDVDHVRTQKALASSGFSTQNKVAQTLEQGSKPFTCESCALPKSQKGQGTILWDEGDGLMGFCYECVTTSERANPGVCEDGRTSKGLKDLMEDNDMLHLLN